jgi:hypothetical protein
VKRMSSLVLVMVALVFGACTADAGPESELPEGNELEMQAQESALQAPVRPPSSIFASCQVTSEGPEGRETAFFARNSVAATRSVRPIGMPFIPVGSCASLQIKCPSNEAPVCAVVGREPPATFTNRCILRAATIKAAGAFGSAAGRVTAEGPCGGARPACTSSLSCGNGEHCSVEDGVCNAPPGCQRPGSVCPAVCTGFCVANLR